MKLRWFFSPLGFVSLLFISIPCSANSKIPSLIDDSEIHFKNLDSGTEFRKSLLKFIFGTEELPREFKIISSEFIEQSPILGIKELDRVEKIVVQLDGKLTSTVFIFSPKRGNGKTTIYHHGHSPAIGSEGSDRLLKKLLERGDRVIYLQMPGLGPNENDDLKMKTTDHSPLFSMKHGEGPAAALRAFLVPVAAAISYVNGRTGSDDLTMIGFDGGAWVTTLYAALDSRIKLSYAISGSLPLVLRSEKDIQDQEQFDPNIYDVFGYFDLYLLASLETGRKSFQMYKEKDPCCFAVTKKMDIDRRIRQIEAENPFGEFKVIIDEKSLSHEITEDEIQLILN